MKIFTAKWAEACTRDALSDISDQAGKVGLFNTDEFTFRSYFMARCSERLGGLRLQSEWRRFDLLLIYGAEIALIEFKYFLTRRNLNLDGSLGGYKGGASKKNEREFWECVEKLEKAAPDQFGTKFLILAYQSNSDRRSKYSYESSYGDLKAPSRFKSVSAVTHEQLAARVFEL